MSALELAIVANTRMPSKRAQGLQVAQSAAAFARAGISVRVLHARRSIVVDLAMGTDAFDWYGVPRGARPALVPIACIDWIERVPRVLQYVPARLQEESFARNAAREILRTSTACRVLAREAECALRLVRAGHERVYIEVHRVPNGRIRRRALLAAARAARGTIAISGGVQVDLVELGLNSASIRVEHDGFEAARFARLPERRAARAELGVSLDAPLVVYTGGLLAWKGVDVLVDAARELPDAFFLIAGGVPQDVERIRRAAAGRANVRVDGFQSPDRIALYYAAADLGVVPNRSAPAISARYTSPLKVFEAMATGLPLVASDLPALRELLVHEVDAVLVAPDDAAALAHGIARILGDSALRARLAARMRTRAPEHTWDARARRILDWMSARESAVKS